MTSTLTIRIDAETKSRLESLADATERSRSYLAGQAIRDYVNLNEWQIGEIKTAIQEADAGDFASVSEVNACNARWTGAD